MKRTCLRKTAEMDEKFEDEKQKNVVIVPGTLEPALFEQRIISFGVLIL